MLKVINKTPVYKVLSYEVSINATDLEIFEVFKNESSRYENNLKYIIIPNFDGDYEIFEML